MRGIFISLTLLLLPACSSLLPKATLKETYILGSKEEHFCEASGSKGTITAIAENGSPDFFLSSKIFFKNRQELGSYQLAEWSEILPQRLVRLIGEKLRCDGYEVGNLSEIRDSNQTIVFEILEFSHHIDSSPGSFKAVFRVKTEKGQKQKEKLFSFEEEVNLYDVTGVREAADRILSKFLTELSLFISN